MQVNGARSLSNCSQGGDLLFHRRFQSDRNQNGIFKPYLASEDIVLSDRVYFPPFYLDSTSNTLMHHYITNLTSGKQLKENKSIKSYI